MELNENQNLSAVCLQLENGLDSHMLQESLTLLLDKLNKEQLQAILLCFVEHQRTEEIAEHLGIPEKTVKSRISKGLKCMGECGHELQGRGYVFGVPFPFIGIAALSAEPDRVYAKIIPDRETKAVILQRLEKDQGAECGS